MDSWEQKQDFELDLGRATWEDEDEVADNWDAAEEAKPAPHSKPALSSTKTKESKTFTIASEEPVLGRKQRETRLQKVSDLENAMHLFGVSKEEVNIESVLGPSLSGMAESKKSENTLSLGNPSTIPEFDHLVNTLAAALTVFESNKNYPLFLDNLFRRLASTRDAAEVRKLAATLTTLAVQRQKEQRDATISAKAKKKPPTLKMAGGKIASAIDFNDYGNAYEDDEYAE